MSIDFNPKKIERNTFMQGKKKQYKRKRTHILFASGKKNNKYIMREKPTNWKQIDQNRRKICICLRRISLPRLEVPEDCLLFSIFSKINIFASLSER